MESSSNATDNPINSQAAAEPVVPSSSASPPDDHDLPHPFLEIAPCDNDHIPRPIAQIDADMYDEEEAIKEEASNKPEVLEDSEEDRMHHTEYNAMFHGHDEKQVRPKHPVVAAASPIREGIQLGSYRNDDNDDSPMPPHNLAEYRIDYDIEKAEKPADPLAASDD